MCLAMLSLGSYVFLNTVTPKAATPSSDELPTTEATELKALEKVETALPDILLLQKILEAGKRIVPGS
jgi:hypothetical protein